MLILVYEEGEKESYDSSGNIDTEEDNDGKDPNLGPFDDGKLCPKKEEEQSFHGHCQSRD